MTIDETVRKNAQPNSASPTLRAWKRSSRKYARPWRRSEPPWSRAALHPNPNETSCVKTSATAGLPRKNGILSSIDENWLKTASKDLKPSVGRSFNALRHESAVLEIAALTKDVPLRAQAPRDIKVSVSDSFSLNDSVSATRQPCNSRGSGRPHSPRQPAATWLAASRHADAARN